MHLANAIERASDGDVILVHDEFMRELALNAKARMRPELSVEFRLE